MAGTKLELTLRNVLDGRSGHARKMVRIRIKRLQRGQAFDLFRAAAFRVAGTPAGRSPTCAHHLRTWRHKTLTRRQPNSSAPNPEFQCGEIQRIRPFWPGVPLQHCLSMIYYSQKRSDDFGNATVSASRSATCHTEQNSSRSAMAPPASPDS